MTKVNEMSRKELAEQQLEISRRGIEQCKQQIKSYGRFVWENGQLLDLEGSIARFNDMKKIYTKILNELEENE
jgi:hypothetical protein